MIKFKNFFLDKNIILALISIYPIALVIGSAASEFLNLLILFQRITSFEISIIRDFKFVVWVGHLL